jgi:hypothetical protein
MNQHCTLLTLLYPEAAISGPTINVQSRVGLLVVDAEDIRMMDTHTDAIRKTGFKVYPASVTT